MQLDIDVRGVPEIVNFMKELGSKGVDIINDEQYKLVVYLRKYIVQSMRSTPRGSVNSKGVLRKFGYPSKYGFPPAIQSGNLMNRIIPEKGYGFSRLFTDNVKYAEILEDPQRLNRPFWAPAVANLDWEQRIKNRILAERFANRSISE